MKTLLKKEAVFPEVPSFFDDFEMRDFFRPFYGTGGMRTIPAVNVKETDKSFELELAVPGMKKEDFKIELQNDTLTISAEREEKKEEKDKEDSYSRREFSYRSFSRSFSLPEKLVDGEHISANYRDGILRLSVPKTQKESKAPKRIEIS
jgi:HSP20 family protein